MRNPQKGEPLFSFEDRRAMIEESTSHLHNVEVVQFSSLVVDLAREVGADVIVKGLTLQGVYGRQMFETWYQMEQMLLGGLEITPVITHRIPADRFEEGFAVMESGECGKVVLDWEEGRREGGRLKEEG